MRNDEIQGYIPPTANQVGALVRLFLESGICERNAHALLTRGHARDLFVCDADNLDRNAHRKALGLTPVATKLPRNRHGHFVVTVTGLDFTGDKEIEAHCFGNFFSMSEDAKACFYSKNNRGVYDQEHQLIGGQSYRLVVVPAHRIKGARTYRDALAYGQRFNYVQPRAGVVPRLFKCLTESWFQATKMSHLAVMHKPYWVGGLEDGSRGTMFLGIRPSDHVAGYQMVAYSEMDIFNEYGGFVFLDSEQP